MQDYLEIEVKGLAPDDVEVTDLVNVMSDHPLFTRVMMRYSQFTEYQGLFARKFLINARVPLDRHYVPTRTISTAEASHED